MLESFTITFSQIVVLFSFIAIGYWLKKTNKIADFFNKGLSNLLVYIFMPAITFKSVSENFTLKVMSQYSFYLLASCVLMCFFLVVAFIISRTFVKNKNTRDVYMYSFTFPNSGYIGNPLVLAVFGELFLFKFIVFCIPFMLLTYTFGIYILNPNRKFNIKSICNPIIISVVLGIIAGILNIRLPGVATNILEMSANCMAPSAMILTGIVFASNNLIDMISNKKIYIACALKMVLIPAIAVVLLKVMNLPEDVSVITIVLLTLPTGLNSIVFPEAYGGDSRTGAQLCFVSTVYCLFAAPLALAFYNCL